MAFIPVCTRCRVVIKGLGRTVASSYSVVKRNKTMGRKTVPADTSSNTTVEDSPVPSLLAQKIVRMTSKRESLNKSSDLPQDAKDSLDLKSRLENLFLELDEVAVKSDTTTETFVKQDDFNEDFVESIMFPSDFKATPKPSPILGTEDSSIPPSNVPCVGCGAHLQCQHNTFPGFLPSEYYKWLSEVEMKTTLCQRCYYIQHCNAFKEVSTDPQEYRALISQIRHTRSAVVLVVDVMDMSGSIVPNLTEYIGADHPLIVVGNKADLLCPDQADYLSRVTEQLKSTCYAAGLTNIRRVSLVSAKTGFGLERLINTLFGLYRKRLDVYIVGTANAGKSSLFNALLASDYCKSSARNLIERATVSVWPGTTLNLLKFPITRVNHQVMALRQKRLRQEVAQDKLRRQIERERAKSREKSASWELKESVHTTDVRSNLASEAEERGAEWGQAIAGYTTRDDGTLESATASQGSPSVYNADQYDNSYWAFDTPGVINPDQVFNLLTEEEMQCLSPKSMVVPRSVRLLPQETLFVSGLGRVDYLEGEEPVMLAVHCSPDLPMRVVPTGKADDYYMRHCGTKVLGVPLGDRERLARLPSLVGKEFRLVGEDVRKAVADIQLSSIGWVSIAPKRAHQCVVRVFTPGRRGMALRTPALLPQHLVYKGKKIGKTAFFRTQPPGWVMARDNK